MWMDYLEGAAAVFLIFFLIKVHRQSAELYEHKVNHDDRK